MENGAKVNGADTPCLLQQCGQIKVIVARVGLKLLSQRRQTNIAPRHFSQLAGVPVMALGSGTVAIHIPDFRDSKTLAAGQFSSMTPKSNSRISVTTADMSSEPAHPSLFEKKTNSSASAGQTLEKNLDRGIMLRVAVGESLARPSQLGRQVAHVLAEAAHFFRRLCEILGPNLDALGLGQLDSEHFSSRAGGAEHDTTDGARERGPSCD